MNLCVRWVRLMRWRRWMRSRPWPRWHWRPTWLRSGVGLIGFVGLAGLVGLIAIAGACASASETRSSTPAGTSADATFNATANSTASKTPTNAVVVRVIDGDTVDVSFSGSVTGKHERVRLIGVDTPETKKPNTPIQCFGPEASDFTKHLLTKGTPVLIRRDAEARDDYGRLLGYVYRSSDGLFVNLELARLGYARPLTIAPNNSRASDFVKAARDAEAANLGLWAACSR